jgi:HSP20 family molecular chaperone IbpA
MWSDALELMSRAERLHRQMFEPATAAGGVSWEPPVDMLETETEVLVLAALPGVDPNQMRAEIQGRALVITGERQLPAELATAVIHRLELPQGRFQRRIPLPPGVYRGVSHALVNGCLLIRLNKAI